MILVDFFKHQLKMALSLSNIHSNLLFLTLKDFLLVYYLLLWSLLLEGNMFNLSE